MQHPIVSSSIPPFRMLGNVYFVGSRAVSVHLIDTGDGLILLDTGYPDMHDQILSSICALGFDPRDIRILLHSHGHYDHIGCTADFKAMSGAQTCISRIDNEIVNGRLDLSWARELGHDPLPPFDCDVLLEDDDEIALGDTRIRCHLAPGHTAGTMCFAFEFRASGKIYTAAMHGGVGLNSMSMEFLRAHGLDPNCRDVFRAGLRRLKKLHVDMVLGNHPDQNDTEGKRARLLAGDPLACVDASEWPRFLSGCEAALDQMLRSEQKDSLRP